MTTVQTGDRANVVRFGTVIDEVCMFYDVTVAQLMKPRIFNRVSQVRHLCMYLLRKHVGMTLAEIGIRLGGRDHSTVLHGIRSAESRLAADPEFAKQVALIESYLKGK